MSIKLKRAHPSRLEEEEKKIPNHYHFIDIIDLIGK